jgi:hypothetical protein
LSTAHSPNNSTALPGPAVQPHPPTAGLAGQQAPSALFLLLQQLASQASQQQPALSNDPPHSAMPAPLQTTTPGGGEDEAARAVHHLLFAGAGQPAQTRATASCTSRVNPAAQLSSPLPEDQLSPSEQHTAQQAVLECLLGMGTPADAQGNSREQQQLTSHSHVPVALDTAGLARPPSMCSSSAAGPSTTSSMCCTPMDLPHHATGLQAQASPTAATTLPHQGAMMPVAAPPRGPSASMPLWPAAAGGGCGRTSGASPAAGSSSPSEDCCYLGVPRSVPLLGR